MAAPRGPKKWVLQGDYGGFLVRVLKRPALKNTHMILVASGLPLVYLNVLLYPFIMLTTITITIKHVIEEKDLVNSISGGSFPMSNSQKIKRPPLQY